MSGDLSHKVLEQLFTTLLGIHLKWKQPRKLFCLISTLTETFEESGVRITEKSYLKKQTKVKDVGMSLWESANFSKLRRVLWSPSVGSDGQIQRSLS